MSDKQVCYGVAVFSCPYCGQECGVSVYNPYQHIQLIACDAEHGGCDGNFAVQIKTVVRFEVGVSILLF